MAEIEGVLDGVAREIRLPTDALTAYLQGGKRLRARLVLLVSTLGERRAERVVPFAAFVELIHAGGLCHDDVVDRSTERRSRMSIAAAFGSRTAAHVGLALMTRAYTLVADAPQEVRDAVARAAERVATGQAEEMYDTYRLDLEPEHYLQRCRAKTGALFELAAELGAFAVGLDPETRAGVASFGREAGLAFQLVDDVRDLLGDAVPGRPAGSDLREGIYTLPVLLTVRGRHARANVLRTLLGELRGPSDPAPVVETVQRLLTENGAIQATLEVAAMAVRRATQACDGLPRGARTALSAYADDLAGAALRGRLLAGEASG